MDCINDIYNVTYKYGNIITAMIELTNCCNWKCEHCYVTDTKHDKYNIEILNKLFIKLREYGVSSLILIGGEIFLRDDIFEIISLARNMFFQVSLESNISLLNEEKVEMLSKLYVEEIACSIFSLDDKVHDSITGVKGSLKAALKNLELLKKYNINVLVKTPIMRKNKYAYKSLYKYCLDRDIVYKVNTTMFPKRNGEVLDNLNLKECDLKEIITDTDNINKLKILDRSPDDYACRNLRSSIFFDTQGEAYPCINMRLSLGNIFLDGLDKIFNSNKRKTISNLRFKDLDQCIGCNIFSKCTPCPAIAFLESGSYTNCSKLMAKSARCR